jgi:beta-glucosidase
MAWTHDDFTLEERCRLLVGDDAWHTVSFPDKKLPSLMMADGPHGLRKQKASSASVAVQESYPAICYPPAVTLAASFDVDTVRTVGTLIGEECRAEQVHVILGPGLNIKRSPLCGRNFEYYSEDPLVAGELAKAFVEGVQSQNVGACLKHFALNNQETRRMTTSSVADVRTIREIYTSGFETALKADPAMVMCSYNKIDGVYAAENNWLLNTLLRQTFGYRGVVVSDWTAVADRVKSVLATLDLEMPGHAYAANRLYQAAMEDDAVAEAVNASCDRMLSLIERYATTDPRPVDREKNHQEAARIAAECAVLLQNDGILPLAEHTDLCLIGALAIDVRYQGGGSSHVHPFRLETLADQFRGVNFARGYTLSGDGYDKDLIREAVLFASRSEVAVIVVGLTDEYESEGYDRTHLSLPKGHDLLIEAVAAANPNTVVVLQIGSPVLMPWRHKVRAILNGYLGGEAGHLALFDILYGKVNPSGRLAETFPNRLEDLSSSAFFANGNHEVHYREAVYVGYRDLTTRDVEALFPFGHGLSYTTFAYANLSAFVQTDGATRRVEVGVEVTNTGSRDGKEVVLLFVEAPKGGVFRPKRELRAFRKITLSAGETRRVAFSLEERAFAYFDPGTSDWEVVEGEYKIQIRKDAQTPLLEATVFLTRPSTLRSDPRLDRGSYQPGMIAFDPRDFEHLIGRSIEGTTKQAKRPFTIDNTLEDVSSTFLGRQLKKIILRMATKAIAGQDPSYVRMVTQSVLETPLRSIAIMSGGSITVPKMMGIVAFLNNRPFSGLILLLGGTPK